MGKSQAGPGGVVSIEVQRPLGATVASAANQTRTDAAETIVAWQTAQIHRLLSVLTVESQSRFLKVMDQSLQNVVRDHLFMATRGVGSESSSLAAKEYQDELEKLTTEIKKNLGL